MDFNHQQDDTGGLLKVLLSLILLSLILLILLLSLIAWIGHH